MHFVSLWEQKQWIRQLSDSLAYCHGFDKWVNLILMHIKHLWPAVYVFSENLCRPVTPVACVSTMCVGTNKVIWILTRFEFSCLHCWCHNDRQATITSAFRTPHLLHATIYAQTEYIKECVLVETFSASKITNKKPKKIKQTWHFHKNIRYCVKNECCCPRTVNISNVNFTFKRYLYRQSQCCKTWDSKCQALIAKMHSAWTRRLGARVPLRSRYFLSQKLWHFYKNIRSCVKMNVVAHAQLTSKMLTSL